MPKSILYTLLLCYSAAISLAQTQVSISPSIRPRLTKDTTRLITALDSFITKENQPAPLLQKQLINFYPLEKGEYWLTVACSDSTSLLQIRTFVASEDSNHITLASPLAYLTRHWQTTQIGHIAYHYPDTINLTRARAFEKNNETIAQKLGVAPENFDFYLTGNYQQILALQGYEFDAKKGRSNPRRLFYGGSSILRHSAQRRLLA